MSASRERKKRLAQEQQPAPVEKKKKKLSEGWILAISVVLILAIVFGSILGYNSHKRNRTVLTVGGEELSATEFNYFFYGQAFQVNDYATILGINSSTGLDEQKISVSAGSFLALMGATYDFTNVPNDGTNYELTWAEYFADAAKTAAAQVYSVCQAAKADGYVLTEDDLAAVEDELSMLETYAALYGISADDYVEQLFGMGDMESYRAYLEANQIAASYTEAMTFDEAEMDAFYAEHKEDHDIATFHLAMYTSAEFAETDEEGNKLDATDEDREEAKAEAEALAAEFDEADEQVSAYADYSKSMVEGYFTEDIANWMFDEAAEGDVKFFEVDENTWYVVKLLDKDDYNTINITELFIAYDDEDVALGEGVMSAEEKLAAVEESLKADNSLKNIEALVEDYNDESGDGKVENLARSSVLGVSDEILAWYMEEHVVGDWKAFETTDGYVVLYFTSYGESYRNLSLTNAMMSQWVSDTTDAALDTCEYDEDAHEYVFTDLVLGTTTTSAY